MEWSALPVLCEMFGYTDPAVLVTQLAAIRDWQAAERAA